jgi:hypothetical protein
MSKLVIELTDDQVKMIKSHLSEQGKINQENETFSGYSFTLSCTESGISWLDLEMNTSIEIGDVNWSIQ